MDVRLRTERSRKASEKTIRVVFKVLSAVLPHKKVHSHRAKPLKNPWQFERRDPIDTKHVQRRRIVAEHQRPSIARSPAKTLFAKAEFPIRQRQADIRVQQRYLRHSRPRDRRR